MPKSNETVQLKHEYNVANKWEIGVDEAGRGPLFGRLYVAGVILPKSNPEFKYHILKDSKKFHSPKKIREVAEYIKTNAVAWHIHFCEAEEIDKINIRQSVLLAMRTCCSKLIEYACEKDGCDNIPENLLLLIDGNDFPPYTQFDRVKEEIVEIPSVTVEGGDNTYCAIAAASILAKVARDDYIEELCSLNPELNEKYGIEKNKGYGTKTHMAGIREHGVTKWHRMSYKPCAHARLR